MTEVDEFISSKDFDTLGSKSISNELFHLNFEIPADSNFGSNM